MYILDQMRGENKALHTYLLENAIFHLGNNEKNEGYEYTLHVHANMMLYYLSHTIKVERCQIIRVFFRMLVMRELRRLIFTGDYDMLLVTKVMMADRMLWNDTVDMKYLSYIIS